MISITVRHEAAGHRFTAELEGERVTIQRDGQWAAEGRWDEGIYDCAANLLTNVEASEEVYAAIEAAIRQELPPT